MSADDEDDDDDDADDDDDDSDDEDGVFWGLIIRGGCSIMFVTFVAAFPT